MLKQKLKNIKREDWLLYMFGSVLALALAFWMPVNVFAADSPLGGGYTDVFQNVKEYTEVDIKSDAVETLKSFISGQLIPIFKYVFAGIAILFFTYSVFMIASSGGDEEQVSKHRKTMLWALIGFGLISVSADIALIFDPTATKGKLADTDKAKSVIQKFVVYMQLTAGVIAIIGIFYSGVRFITAHGDEETITGAKNNFTLSILGLIFAMLADPLVNKVFYPMTVQGPKGPGITEAEEFSSQIVGLIKFILTFLAILVFISFLVSGGFFLTSFGDEERHNRAKEILIGSIIGCIIIFSSYAILAVFIPS